MELKDKHILLIALPGYCDGILKKMEELGADVDLIIDKPNEGFICKTFGRYKVGFYQKIIHNYYKEQLRSLKSKNYDYILAIRGEYTPIATLKLLKLYYPNSQLILYMWDGLGNISTKGIEKNGHIMIKYTHLIVLIMKQIRINFLSCLYIIMKIICLKIFLNQIVIILLMIFVLLEQVTMIEFESYQM